MVGYQHDKRKLAQLYRAIVPHLAPFEPILFYGALLGYVREGDFIDLDNDIDLLVHERHHADLVRTISSVEHVTVQDEGRITFLLWDQVKEVEVYWYTDHGNDILIWWDGNILFYKSDIFPLQRVLFHQVPTLIPNRAEEVVRLTYGDDWRVPQQQYNWYDVTQVRFLSSTTRSFSWEIAIAVVIPIVLAIVIAVPIAMTRRKN